MALRSFLDGALFAEVYGNRPPRVLAMHGWGRRGSDFGPALGDLDVLSLDLPGFGASPVPSEAWGAHQYAELVSGILAEYEEPPVVVGHSFGGRVAVCLADRYPDLIGPLVLTGVPLLRALPGGKPSASFRLARSLNRVGLISDDRMEAIRRNRGSADYRASTGIMRDILVRAVHETYEEEMSAIRSRVELLWGADDLEVPLIVAQQSLSMLQDATLNVIDDVGHMVPLRAPDRLREVVEGALA